MFVDNSGRRSKLLRRLGLLAGVLCLGYAVVLGLAFMGIGAAPPSSLLPFAGSGPGGGGGGRESVPGGARPQGNLGTPPARPGGTASAGTAGGAPSSSPSSSPSASASAAE